MKRPYISLLHKALLALTALALPLLITFAYTYNLNKNILKKDALKNLTIIAEAYEGQVYQFIEMQRRRAQDFSSDGFIRDQLQKIVNGNKSAVSSLNSHLIKNKLPLDKFVHNIYIISPDGRIAASTHGTAIGNDVSKETFFAKGNADWNIIEESTTIAELPALAVSNPITNKDTGRHIGTLVNIVSLSAFNEIFNGNIVKGYQLGALTQSVGEPFNTMEAYLVNKDKLMVTESLFIKGAILKQKVDTLPVQECINANKETTGFYKDYRGIEVAGASMCLSQLKWTLLSEIDADEILMPVHIVKRNATIVLALVAGFIVLLFILFFRNVALPLRKITVNTKAMANGNYDVSAPVKSGDEIGILAASFNSMAHQIKNRTSLLDEEKVRAVKAEEAARESRKKYEMLINSVDSIVWEADPATFQFTFVSEQAERLLGYPVEQWLNEPTFWKDHLHPDDKEQAVSYCMTATAKGRSHEFEYRMVAADGRFVWLRDIVSVISTNNQAIKLYGLLIDITEHKRAEEARFETRQKYEDLINNLNVGIYRRMLDGRLVEVNPAAVDMFEAGSREEFTKYNVIDLYKDKDKFKEVTGKLLKNGFIKNEELEVLTAKGRAFWCSLNAVTKKDKDGNVYIDGIVEDISERKRLEEQLMHSQKMEAIGQLAGGIAHDFNNILTAILGYGNLLLRKRGTDDMVKEYADEIISSANRAAILTRDLLTFSRKHVINPQPADLNKLIERVKKILARLIGEHIEIKINLQDKDMIVKMDTSQIEHVLLNLATNARDAMPNGGTITITASHVRLGEEFVGVHHYAKPGNYALITFADTGAGIDKAIQSRIFDPFFTTKEVGKGTGLGLSMAYGIIKQHNGYIHVYSEPGHGAVFKIYLPLVIGEASAAEQKQTEAVFAKGNGELILLAEDEAAVRKVTKTTLEEFGYKVIEAENGEDAVHKFIENKDKIKLLIFDTVMPKLSGKQAYEEIKKIDRDIKTIFMSGYAYDIIKTQDLFETGIELLTKPVTADRLLEKVKEALKNEH